MDDFKEFNLQHAIETYKSLITISTTVFKYLFLLNGGAAVAMITGLEKLPGILPVSIARWSMALFILGLVTAGITTFLSYFTQSVLHEENMNREKHGSHKGIRLSAILCCAASLALFCAGALVAVFGMR